MSIFGNSEKRFKKLEKQRAIDKFTAKVKKIIEKEVIVDLDMEIMDTVLTMSEIFSGKYQETKMWGKFKKALAVTPYPIMIFKIKRSGPWVLTNATVPNQQSGRARIEIPAKGTAQNAYVYPLELFCKEYKV